MRWYIRRVIEEQFAATVWPYLAIETTYNPTSIDMHLVNDGAGPALIRSAQLFLDGKPVAGWGDVIRAVARDPKTLGFKATISSSSTDASVAIRPGETHGLISMQSSKASRDRRAGKTPHNAQLLLLFDQRAVLAPARRRWEQHAACNSPAGTLVSDRGHHRSPTALVT